MTQMQLVAEPEEIVRVPQAARRLNASPSIIPKWINAVRTRTAFRNPISEIAHNKREGTRPQRLALALPADRRRRSSSRRGTVVTTTVTAWI